MQTSNKAIKFPGFSRFNTSKTSNKRPGGQPVFSVYAAGKKSIAKGCRFVAAGVVAAFIFSSCEKAELTDPSSERIASDDMIVSDAANTAPKVEAGPLKRVIFPASSTTKLSGSGSDKEGGVTYAWSQVGGNSNANIEQPNKPATVVSNLKPGLYSFVLKVTDNNGASRTDTALVTVLQQMTWTIEGVKREALVHPATGNTGAAPVIFAFHGHGGKSKGFAQKGFELEWPEAIVVYPQGLQSEGHSDPQAKYTGWQHDVGEVNVHTGIKDQDLKFFDAMLSKFKNIYNVNTKKVFAHGWSNGANFVYDVLWTAREDRFAALAPAAATLRTTNGKSPMPVIHVAGTNDDKASFSKQQQTVEKLRGLNKCSSNGTPWASGPNGLLGTRYASSVNAPVVMLQYNGGHGYPFTVPPFIVQFFKEVSGS